MSFFPGGMGGALGNGVVRIGAETGGIRGQVRQGMRAVKQEMDAGARDIEQSGRRASKGFGLITAAAKATMFGLVGIVGIGVGAAMQFESAWAGVRKTVDATPERLAALRGEFRQLAKEIPVSVNELAKIGETAGALGIPTEAILDFTKTVALLGQTTDVSTEQASTALGQLSNVLNMTGEDYEKFASTLVDLGNKGASTESQILEITSRAGAGAALIGFSTKQTLAWASSIASLGIEVEAGGSSLQNFFLKSQKLVNDPNGLKTLASVAGMTGDAFKQAFEEDASSALMTFIAGLGQLNASDQLAVLDALKMNDIRITRGLLGLANKPELLAQNLDVATAAWEANVAVTAEAEKRFETTASALGLLKNVLQDMFIEAGDQALPAVKALVIFFRDMLPQAIDFLAKVWNEKLLPPLEKVGEAFGHLGASVGKLFGGGDGADWASTTGTAVEGLASAVGHLANIIATVVDGFAALLENPIIAWLARGLLLLKGWSIALGLVRGAVGGLNGMSGSLLRGLGLGRLMGSSGARGATDPSMALNGSAANLDRSAMNLDRAAGALGRSGAMGGGSGRYTGSPYDLRYAKDPAYSRRTGGGSLFGAMGQPLAYGIGDKDKWAANPNFGRNLAQRFMGGAAGAMTKGLSSIKNLAMGGLSLASKAFWPLMIASFATELVKAPIGDLISKNTRFRRAGELMKEDFFGGLIGLASSWWKGSDLSLAIERLPVGNKSIATADLRNVNLTDAQIEAIQQPGVAGAQAQRDILPQAVKDGLQKSANESVADWAKRVQKTLSDAGVNTALLETAMQALPPPEDLGPLNFLHQWDSSWLKSTEDAENLVGPQITDAVNQMLGIGISSVQAGLQKGLNDGVVEAVRTWSGGRVKLTDLLNLPTTTYDKLADLMVLDAKGLIDPRVLSMTLSGILDKPTAQTPFGGGTGGIRDRQELTPKAQALNAERRDIKADQQSLDDWVRSLTPDQTAAREASMNVLAAISAGIKEAGKDESKQAAFLADINEALGLSGASKMTWTELIDWNAQLGEETGVTAQKQLERRTKKLAVMAARSGAQGGAAEFMRVWGTTVEGADTEKEKEALRKKLNKLIPGKADDFSKKEFSSWLTDVQKKGAEEAKATRDKATKQFWSGGLKNPDIKDSVTTTVGNDVESIMGNAAKEAVESEALMGRLSRYGVKITKGIASGIKSPEAKASITAAIGEITASIKPQLPGSPVAAGPLKHPYLLDAGRGIVDQIGLGMKRSSLALPSLDLSGAAMAGGEAGGRGVTIYADKLQTFSPSDKRSLTQQFDFLAQDGR